MPAPLTRRPFDTDQGSWSDSSQLDWNLPLRDSAGIWPASLFYAYSGALIPIQLYLHEMLFQHNKPVNAIEPTIMENREQTQSQNSTSFKVRNLYLHIWISHNYVQYLKYYC